MYELPRAMVPRVHTSCMRSLLVSRRHIVIPRCILTRTLAQFQTSYFHKHAQMCINEPFESMEDMGCVNSRSHQHCVCADKPSLRIPQAQLVTMYGMLHGI